MKKVIIKSLIIFQSISAFAQIEYEYVPFPTSDAIWTEEYIFYVPDSSDPLNPILTYEYDRFALSGEDTVIDNLSYKKLYVFFDDFFEKSNAQYVGGIREDENKRIYFKGEPEGFRYLKPDDLPTSCGLSDDFSYEILLYDFSKNIGDIIYFECVDHFFTVTDIELVQIGNSYRKKFTLDYSTEWIEGIGSLWGLFFRHVVIPTSSYGPRNKLVCFIQDGEILYSNNEFEDCFPSSKIETSKNSQGILVYACSLNENLIFDFGELPISKFSIYDITGRTYEKLDVKMHTSFVLPKKKYNSGIYFYKANERHGNNYVGRFIVKQYV